MNEFCFFYVCLFVQLSLLSSVLWHLCNVFLLCLSVCLVVLVVFGLMALVIGKVEWVLFLLVCFSVQMSVLSSVLWHLFQRISSLFVCLFSCPCCLRSCGIRYRESWMSFERRRRSLSPRWRRSSSGGRDKPPASKC